MGTLLQVLPGPTRHHPPPTYAHLAWAWLCLHLLLSAGTPPHTWSMLTWSLAPPKQRDPRASCIPVPLLPSAAELLGVAAFTSCLDTQPWLSLWWCPHISTRRPFLKRLTRLRDLRVLIEGRTRCRVCQFPRCPFSHHGWFQAGHVTPPHI